VVVNGMDTVSVRRRGGKELVYSFATGRAERRKRTDAEIAKFLKCRDLAVPRFAGEPSDVAAPKEKGTTSKPSPLRG